MAETRTRISWTDCSAEAERRHRIRRRLDQPVAAGRPADAASRTLLDLETLPPTTIACTTDWQAAAASRSTSAIHPL
jgi:hypothetical protein